MTPFINTDPATFYPAAKRIAGRDRAARRRLLHHVPRIFARLFLPDRAHADTARICRLSPKETVISNL